MVSKKGTGKSGIGGKKKELCILEENANARKTRSLNCVLRPMCFLQHLNRLSVLGWNNDDHHINNDIDIIREVL